MRKRLFFGALCLLLLINETNFTFVVPIIPDFLLKQGVSLSVIGFILSFYQISYFFTSLYLGKHLNSYSKTKVMIGGQAVLIISNVALSLLDHNFNMAMVIALSSMLRFMQGLALALVCAGIYAYVPILYPHDLDKKYAIVEISLGCGLALGPVIGGFLYEYCGYFWSFMTMGFVYLAISMVVFPFFFTFKINKAAAVKDQSSIDNASLSKDLLSPTSPQQQDNDDQEESEEYTSEPLKMRDIMRNRDFLLTFLVYLFNYMCYYLIQPGFSQHVHDYNGDEDTVGLIFGLGDITYALTGFLLMRFISSNKVKRKLLFIFGGFVSMLALLVLGPEDYTFLPKSLITVTVGMGMLGFAQMFYTATLIPEYIDIFREMDPTAKGTDEMACGLFNASVALTEFFGAILGGLLSDNFGFSRGMALYAMVLLAYLIFFALVRTYPKPKSLNQQNRAISDCEDFLIKEKGDTCVSNDQEKTGSI